MHLEILTPSSTILQKDLTSVNLPGLEGEFTVLEHHSPICSSLKDGIVKILGKSQIAQKFFVKNALAFVDNDKVVISCDYVFELNAFLSEEYVSQQIAECVNNLDKKGKDTVFHRHWHNMLECFKVIESYCKQNKKT